VYRILKWYTRAADRLSEWGGLVAAWLAGALVLLVFGNVVARYGFRTSSIAMQELEWHLFGALFLLGAAYTLKHDQHVRVDVIYTRLSERGQAAINLAGTVVFLLPFAALVAWTSADYAQHSFQMREGSRDGGLPALYLLKAVIPIAFSLVLLQGVALVCRSILILAGRHAPSTDTEPPDQ
jgi:TRAP-type mannitol/chloroaromatic compound transport system permease small subunit